MSCSYSCSLFKTISERTHTKKKYVCMYVCLCFVPAYMVLAIDDDFLLFVVVEFHQKYKKKNHLFVKEKYVYLKIQNMKKKPFGIQVE